MKCKYRNRDLFCFYRMEKNFKKVLRKTFVGCILVKYYMGGQKEWSDSNKNIVLGIIG